ncbi:MAG: hypothetical protein ACYC63_08350 [Armatimonadota bacterium]
MRYCVIALVVAGVFVGSIACCAPKGPLVAGTAPGSTGALSKDYAVGVHYPWDAAEPQGYPAMEGCVQPVNRTAPYDEWPDPARVTGHRPAMSREIWIIGSKRRSDPDNRRPSHILTSYVSPSGREVPAAEPPEQ